jgi:hypothetical protein
MPDLFKPETPGNFKCFYQNLNSYKGFVEGYQQLPGWHERKGFPSKHLHEGLFFLLV